MMRIKYVAALPLLAFATLPNAFGQNNSNHADEVVAFEEIIVTAQKREQSIYDVPAAISAFSANQIEKQGISGLIDVGKFVPNLNVTAFGGGQVTSTNPFIRGIGLQDHLITTDPGVGVYVDGVYLGRQLGQNLSLASTERIEVLRGPQGTLYGRNSIGGAINVITRKPGEENTSRIALQAGSRGRLNAQYYGSYRFNDQLAVSTSIGFDRRDGVGDFTSLDTSTEVGEFEDVSGRISVLWTPTSDFSLLFAADANDADSGLGPYTTLINELPNGAIFQSGLRNSDRGSDPYDNATGEADLADTGNSASGISLTADYSISEQLDLKLVASSRTSDYKTGLDDDSTVANFLAFGEEGEADQTSLEIQLNGTYGKFDFVSGLYYFEEDGFNEQDPNTFNGGAGTFLLEQEVESSAAYINVGYNVSDRVRIGGGLRYTSDDKEGAIDISNFVQSRAEESFSELSWDLSGTYELDNGMTAYASLASGFQSGQFNPRPFCLFGFLDFTQPGNVSAPNCFDQDLDNITALNYEIGVKGQLTDNLQMSLAVFNTDYSDLPYQVSTTTPEGFNTVSLIVDQTSSGLEWESSWRVSDGFYLNTSLGYIDVDVDASDPAAAAPLTPEYTLSISPEYSFEWATGGTVTLRADYSYRDDMFGEPSSDPGRLTAIESRDLVNFDVSYSPAADDWTVALYGRNITDERYDNARLNTGDYVLRILSNDASEFGLRFIKEF